MKPQTLLYLTLLIIGYTRPDNESMMLSIDKLSISKVITEIEVDADGITVSVTHMKEEVYQTYETHSNQ